MSNKNSDTAMRGGRPKGTKNQTKSPVYLREKPLKSGNKSLYLDIFLGTDTDGNPIHEYEFLKLYLTGNKHADKETLRQAQTIRAARVIEINNGNHNALQSKQAAKADFLTFAELQADKKRTNKRGEINERGTYLTYKSFIFHFKQYAGSRITFKQIDKRFCQGFIDYLKKAISTRDHTPLKINTQLDYIKTFETVLNAAIKQEIITANPMSLCEKPQRQSHDIVFLTVQELKALEQTDCPKPDVKAAFLFACYTGLRFSDVKSLTWAKIIEFAGQTCLHIRQEKTGALQYLPISEKAKQFLPARPDNAADTDTVFNLSTNGYTNIFLQSWARESGITKKISFHTARHTAATLLLALGENIKTISGILGHANSAITEKHYAALQIAPLAAAMNKFNEII